jgi:hypothetical protein
MMGTHQHLVMLVATMAVRKGTVGMAPKAFLGISYGTQAYLWLNLSWSSPGSTPSPECQDPFLLVSGSPRLTLTVMYFSH